MAYNIVRKGKSTVLVKKGRGYEHYICSFGVMTDMEFKSFQQQIHDLPQENRIAYCMKSGLIREVAEDIPRRKAPTGDIREQPVKKEKKAKKVMKEANEDIKEVISDYIPLKHSVILKSEKIEGINVSQIKTSGDKKKAITKRIDMIESKIEDSKIYLKTYKARQGRLSKSEQQMRKNEADYLESYVTEGNKALTILKKQRSEIR